MIENLTEKDKSLLVDIDGFLPDKIFDAHAHLYDTHTWQNTDGYQGFTPLRVDLEVYREQMSMLLGGRELHGMFFPYPVIHKEDSGFAQDNEFVSREIAKDVDSCGQLLVSPHSDPEWIALEVKRLGLRGLKPFAIYASVENPWEAELPDFLPPPLAAVANREHWSITVHLMRRGLDDPSNLYWIRNYCETYPKMVMILDHCARGFNPYWILKGLPKLCDLPNLWIDTSAICNPFSIESVVRIMGIEKVLYGSDYCMSHYRGLNAGVADTFLWIGDNSPAWKGHGHVGTITPTLVGIENLLALKAACWTLNLSESQVERLFSANAKELLV